VLIARAATPAARTCVVADNTYYRVRYALEALSQLAIMMREQ
jgi:hypothetical protein